jgi:2-polyprenyl-3-methyl-5-hydroxy-6-metoxy-1,4-benzoquinol methylase
LSFTIANRYGYLNDGLSDWGKMLGRLIYFHPGRRADLDFSVMYLPAQPNRRLLDVGCGDGRMLKLMQDLGWCVEGVDFDPVAVENGKNKGLKVRLGTLEDQIYPDNHFDVITMSHLIEHVCDPLRLLLECYRILKPGGRLVVVTPNSGSWGHRIFRESWLHLDPPRHLYIFSLPSLRNIITKAGFQRARLSTIIRDANGTFLASRSIRDTGKHKRSNSQPRSIRSWGRVMQFLEWAILKVRPGLGEEIALTAVK